MVVIAVVSFPLESFFFFFRTGRGYLPLGYAPEWFSALVTFSLSFFQPLGPRLAANALSRLFVKPRLLAARFPPFTFFAWTEL